MNARKMFVSLFAIALLSACNGMIPEIIQPAEPTEESSTHTNEVHWSYEGEKGPDHWGELRREYAVCGTGNSQSPINIDNTQPEDLANIVIHYEDSEVRILNNGHTVQVTYDKGYIEVDGQPYHVGQFHYHAPSEHTIDGQSFPAELHIVHHSVDGKAAVVIGILLEEGAENPAYQPFLSNLPNEENEEITGVTMNVADLLPSSQTTFRYAGSLTTPPCTEGISWIVMNTPVQLSANQLASLKNVFEGNNRPVQPLNERPLIEDATP